VKRWTLTALATLAVAGTLGAGCTLSQIQAYSNCVSHATSQAVKDWCLIYLR
jgi:hypothetical protein